MTWIINFFKDIKSIIESLVTLIISLVTGLVNLIKMIPTVLANITSAIGFLPTCLLAFASISITISIIFMLVNRGGNE